MIAKVKIAFFYGHRGTLGSGKEKGEEHND